MIGVALIGGQSRRFGSDKVLSAFRGAPLVEHVVSVLRPLFDDIVLVGHERPGLERFRVIEDIRPGCGPLGGIYTALSATGAESCFVCAADMPNLNSGLIAHMVSLTGTHDIVIPTWSKGREPLHAIYRRTVIPHAEALLARDEFRIFSLIETVDTLFIPEEEIRRFGEPGVLFSNINTMHDMERMGP
jgi:molybdopterin-guanine dinucleotide biosynthesis protein A